MTQEPVLTAVLAELDGVIDRMTEKGKRIGKGGIGASVPAGDGAISRGAPAGGDEGGE